MIYSVEKIEPYYALLQPLWQSAKDEQFSVIGSELLMMETLVKPIKEGDTVLETTFRQMLFMSKEFKLIPITLAVLEKAAYMRAATGLNPPDAIHAATGLTMNCKLFLTNDAIFKRVSGLPTVVLKDIL